MCLYKKYNFHIKTLKRHLLLLPHEKSQNLWTSKSSRRTLDVFCFTVKSALSVCAHHACSSWILDQDWLLNYLWCQKSWNQAQTNFPLSALSVFWCQTSEEPEEKLISEWKQTLTPKHWRWFWSLKFSIGLIFLSDECLQVKTFNALRGKTVPGEYLLQAQSSQCTAWRDAQLSCLWYLIHNVKKIPFMTVFTYTKFS